MTALRISIYIKEEFKKKKLYIRTNKKLFNSFVKRFALRHSTFQADNLSKRSLFEVKTKRKERVCDRRKKVEENEKWNHFLPF